MVPAALVPAAPNVARDAPGLRKPRAANLSEAIGEARPDRAGQAEGQGHRCEPGGRARRPSQAAGPGGTRTGRGSSARGAGTGPGDDPRELWIIAIQVEEGTHP